MTTQHSDPVLALEGLVRLPGPLPRLVLGTWPTPVRRLERLGEAIGVETWVKCDHETGAVLSGNKVRKLELLLGEARDRKAKWLLTVGGLGSHQITANGIYAERIGARSAAIVYPAPMTPWVSVNVALWEKANVKIIEVESAAHLGEGMEVVERELEQPTYLVPSGGSSPLGNLGYLAGGLELAGQIERGEIPLPREIILACGTGGTLAGLALGLALANLRSVRVVGVRCGSADVGTDASVRQQITAMVKLVERRGGRIQSPQLPEILLVDSGAEYGVLTDRALTAIKLARSTEGLELEPTYTGRALAALMDRASALTSDRVLFWNTCSSLTPRDTH